jgi:hypothetical protein
VLLLADFQIQFSHLAAHTSFHRPALRLKMSGAPSIRITKLSFYQQIMHHGFLVSILDRATGAGSWKSVSFITKCADNSAARINDAPLLSPDMDTIVKDKARMLRANEVYSRPKDRGVPGLIVPYMNEPTQ